VIGAKNVAPIILNGVDACPDWVGLKESIAPITTARVIFFLGYPFTRYFSRVAPATRLFWLMTR